MHATIRHKIWHQRHSGKDCNALKWKLHPPSAVPLSGTPLPPFELQSSTASTFCFGSPLMKGIFDYLNRQVFLELILREVFSFQYSLTRWISQCFEMPSTNCHLHRMKRTPKFFLCLFLPFSFGGFRSQNHASPAGPMNAICPMILQETKATYYPHCEQSAGHQMYTRFLNIPYPWQQLWEKGRG